MQALKAHGLTVSNILSTSTADLDQLIKKVGFHNRKADFIKRAAQILHDQYADDVPETFEEVIALPGVGPKMGHLFMQIAWNKTNGIGVDVHVHRISARLGWTKKAKDPEDTRKQLEAWMPRDYWRPVNKLFVGFGQTICTPVATKCSDCALSSGLCPSRKQKKQKTL